MFLLWGRSSVHAALNIHTGASYLFIRSRRVFECSSNRSNEMMIHEKSWEVLENITSNCDAACCPITSDYMCSSSDACQSMKQASNNELRKMIPQHKNTQRCTTNYWTSISVYETLLRIKSSIQTMCTFDLCLFVSISDLFIIYLF